MSTVKYGMSVQVSHPFDSTVEKARAALAEEGFGVLTEIDVKATLKKKIDADFRPYIILGACNPTLAHQALNTELDIGLLLPCNVIVYEDESGEGSVVVAIDPEVQLGVSDADGLEPLAAAVREKLQKAIQSIA